MEIKWVVFLLAVAYYGWFMATRAYDRAHAQPRRSLVARIAIGILYFLGYLLVARGLFLIARDGFLYPFHRWLQ
jgi:hypothetical protein